MRRRNLLACLAVVFAVCGQTVCACTARAAGYWNMPGTHAQRAGHGYGGGYHAPLILGPIRLDGWRLGKPVRLPCAPSPAYACPVYAYSGDCGRLMEAPSSIAGAVPITAPAPAPTPAESVPLEMPTVEPIEATAPDEATPMSEVIIEPLRPLFDPPVQP